MMPTGLSTEQAPPLSIPASFFCTAPVGIVAAGVWLLVADAPPLVARFVPATAVLTHLLTLGFIGAVMLGALYQMIPVVAGVPVPLARAAHAVHAGLVVGLGALVYGLSTGRGGSFAVAGGLLGATVVAFLLPVSVALVRAPTRSDTVRGMRLAVSGLALLVLFGIAQALTRWSPIAVGHPHAWLGAHAALGLVGWIGALVTAVSWQVLPMFYLTEELPTWSRRVTLAAVALTLVAPVTAVALGASLEVTALCGAPGALAVWVLHPVMAIDALRRRKRRRADASIRFWLVGLGVAPLLPVAGILAFALPQPQWTVLFGWLALWGWAGTIVHGMLGRIVPFLVWFHRFSPLVGEARVPSLRELLPERRLHAALALHVVALALGCAAIGTGWRPLTAATGVAVVLTGLNLGANLLHVLRQKPTGLARSTRL